MSLVIPTYNRATHLEKALASIAAASFPDPAQVEVIVVDNNSTDNTGALVKRLAENFPYQLRCIREENQGSSRARNRGVNEARGKYVVFMDDDQLMDSHYLENIPGTFEATGAECIGGPVFYYNAENLPDWLCGLSQSIGQFSFGDQVKVLGPDTHKGLGGGNMAIIRSEFIAAGGFNVHLGHTGNDMIGLEDLEIQDRLRGLGKTIVYTPHLIQYHYLRPERYKKSYWREYFYSYGRSAYIRRSDETGRKRRSRFRIPIWLWRRLIIHDVPAYCISLFRFDSFRRFRNELEIWARMGQIREAMRAVEEEK
jgi:glycosyltransferase involved in cell wall biosynthesis